MKHRLASPAVVISCILGWTASLAYDNESRGPMGYNSDVVTFEVEYPW